MVLLNDDKLLESTTEGGRLFHIVVRQSEAHASHHFSSRLSLLSARPAVTFPVSGCPHGKPEIIAFKD